MVLLLVFFGMVSLWMCGWLSFSDHDFRKQGSEGFPQAVASDVGLVVRMGAECTDEEGKDGFAKGSDMAPWELLR